MLQGRLGGIYRGQLGEEGRLATAGQGQAAGG